MVLKNKKSGVIALAALVVSAMIGGGIFSLPQNMSENASMVAVLCGWIITGVGIFFLANTFRILAAARPDATTGIYAYARIGFGRFTGFQMAWAYWLCNIFGNVGYAVMLMDACDYFFPGYFSGGNNLLSVICGSVVIWLMNYAVWRGMRQAMVINIIGTVFKLLPILLFVIVMIRVFRWNVFADHACLAALVPGKNGCFSADLGEQIKATMLVTLWAFIGIEGAVVVSGNAKDARSVGRATILGFGVCLLIYALLSLLPFGYLPQYKLAALPNPSTAPILQSAVHGAWGGDLMNIGVIIALLTSWLAFTIMIAQIPYAAAQDGTFPRIFAHENKNGAPDVSLLISSAVMQIAMILVHFSHNAWTTMLSITSVMILPPYFACTLFLWKLSRERKIGAQAGTTLRFAKICGIAGSLYALWMIYAAGIRYLLMAFCLQLIGIPFFLWARHNALKDHPEKEGEKIFTPAEALGAWIILLIAIAALLAWGSGKIEL